MIRCETCGRQSDEHFEIIKDGESHIFDSFECAIHALAPTCAHCGIKIVGHGLKVKNLFYCCDHCAREEGEGELEDRALSADNYPT